MNDSEHSKEDPVLERVMTQLSNRESIDWHALEAAHPALRKDLDSLRRVAEVEAAFRTASGDQEEPERQLALEPPETWGHLEVLDRIGQGSFGDVYRARDPLLQRDVALKLAQSPTLAQKKQFLEEGQRLARVVHNGVIRVHGAATHNGRPGLWMDLAEGRSLEQRLEQDGRFSEHEAIELGQALCSALAAVHAKGVVHGDVKAANVLRGDGGNTVLSDFGSALELRAGSSPPSSASPLTAAPEVLRGNQADERSDIYSLGVLLYRLLLNEYPAKGTSVSDLLTWHDREAAPLVRDRRPDVSISFATAIARALEHDPEARWQSAAEFGEALAAIGGTTPSSMPSRLGPRLGSIALLLVALVAAVGLARGWSNRTDADLSSIERNANSAAKDAANNPGGADLPGPVQREREPRFDLFKTGDPEPLSQGDFVRVGDALHLTLDRSLDQLDGPLWLYLANEDANGLTYVLHPLPNVEPSNPIDRGTVRLPGEIDGVQQDWVVTSRSSTESFLIIASSKPLPTLEAEFNKIADASADRTGEPATFGFQTRGVGGLEQSVDAAAPGTLLALKALVDALPEPPPARVVTLRGAPP